MLCGCYASISAEDPRADLWLEVFGELHFPVKIGGAR